MQRAHQHLEPFEALDQVYPSSYLSLPNHDREPYRCAEPLPHDLIRGIGCVWTGVAQRVRLFVVVMAEGEA